MGIPFPILNNYVAKYSTLHRICFTEAEFKCSMDSRNLVLCAGEILETKLAQHRLSKNFFLNTPDRSVMEIRETTWINLEYETRIAPLGFERLWNLVYDI